MSASVRDSLRHRLRIETEDVHSRLDALVSRFDLADDPGLAGFLAFHVRLFGVLDALGPTEAARAAITDLGERARRDLSRLRLGDAAPAPLMTGPIQPLALTYVLAGSRLGGGVLKQRWNDINTGTNGRECAYFDAPSYGDLWQAFRKDAAAINADSAVADSICDDAVKLLGHFADMADGPQIGRCSTRPTAGSQKVDDTILTEGLAP